MAISRMTKVMIAAHRSQAADLLEALQAAGIVEVLDAERAMVSKDWPDLQIEGRRPRDLEEMRTRLERALAFLKPYVDEKRSIFEPRRPVDRAEYGRVVSGAEALELLAQVEQTQSEMDRLCNQCENLRGTLEMLKPWRNLETPVEELRGLDRAVCVAGLVPHQHYEDVTERLAELGAVVQQVGGSGMVFACLIGCMKEQAGEVQKVLRSADFEAVHFEGMTGTVAELIEKYRGQLEEARAAWKQAEQRARDLACRVSVLEILFDHYSNLVRREQARMTSPATESVILLEGWVRQRDYQRLEGLVAQFDAASVVPMMPAEGEEVPVEIDNPPSVRPFETITRLYGMPHPTDVDPTAFLAPFFALFFGICLTDAAYGLVMIGFLWWLMRKIKGDVKFFRMLMVCSVTTVVAGALTGGWCGDAIQVFFPALGPAREALMVFDPLEKPMYFFVISLVLGYLQIIFGVGLAFWHKWRDGRRQEALWDHGTWFIWLNSLTLFGLAKAGYMPAVLAPIFGVIAVAPAVGIVLFSEREGGWGVRIGMGAYNLFSTVFYVGDVLSYIRLMALGMVTAGFGMAINEIVGQVMALGVLGWILGAVIFVGGHVFNIANSSLSAFVHTMRLQFVEFFTKFLAGGGKQFDPLRKEYQHIAVDDTAGPVGPATSET